MRHACLVHSLGIPLQINHAKICQGTTVLKSIWCSKDLEMFASQPARPVWNAKQLRWKDLVMLLKVDLLCSHKSWRITIWWLRVFLWWLKDLNQNFNSAGKNKRINKKGVCKSTVRVQNQVPAGAWNVHDSRTFPLLTYLLLYVHSWVIRGGSWSFKCKQGAGCTTGAKAACWLCRGECGRLSWNVTCAMAGMPPLRSLSNTRHLQIRRTCSTVSSSKLQLHSSSLTCSSPKDWVERVQPSFCMFFCMFF